MFPDALTTPVTYSPVVAQTTTFDDPPTLTLMLPPVLGMLTFDVPNVIELALNEEIWVVT